MVMIQATDDHGPEGAMWQERRSSLWSQQLSSAETQRPGGGAGVGGGSGRNKECGLRQSEFAVLMSHLD